MKLSIILLMFAVLCASCTSENPEMEPACTPEDYVGSYSGILNCGLFQENKTAQVTVATPNTINITIDGEITTCEVQECMIIIPEVVLNISGVPVTTTGTGTLEGNTLTLVQTASAAGGNVSCTTVLMK